MIRPRSISLSTRLAVRSIDQSGSATVNEQVSAKRVSNVRDALIEQGVPAAVISMGKQGVSVVNERSVTYRVRVY